MPVPPGYSVHRTTHSEYDRQAQAHSSPSHHPIPSCLVPRNTTLELPSKSLASVWTSGKVPRSQGRELGTILPDSPTEVSDPVLPVFFFAEVSFPLPLFLLRKYLFAKCPFLSSVTSCRGRDGVCQGTERHFPGFVASSVSQEDSNRDGCPFAARSLGLLATLRIRCRPFFFAFPGHTRPGLFSSLCVFPFI